MFTKDRLVTPDGSFKRSPKEWRATHRTDAGTKLMLTASGAAYSKKEWETRVATRMYTQFHLVGDVWMYRGEPFKGKVTKI